MADDSKKFDRRIMEKSMRDIHKLLEQHDFESVEEANAFLADYVGATATKELSSLAENTPLEQAQDLMHEAWDCEDDEQRIKLAEQAIELSPDCADAYILLGEEKAEKPEEMYSYFEKGVQAGERVLDPELFEEEHLWGILEARPYLRAKEALAHALWMLDRRDESLAQYQDLLRLNKSDNQGMRYWLVPRLLLEKRVQDAEKILDQYQEETTSWMYNRALVSYTQKGNRTIPKRKLRKAVDANPNVAAFFLGLEELPEEPIIGEYDLGGRNEAIAYILEAGEAWLETEGALDWIAHAIAYP